MKVSAIVVSHASAAEVEALLPALAPQVDELLLIANVPGSVPAGVEAVENERPLGYAANVNLGLTRTSGEAVVIANPDAIPRPGAPSRRSARSCPPTRAAASPARACSTPTAAPSPRGGASPP